MARPKNDLRMLVQRADIARYIHAGKHLLPDGSCRSLRSIAIDLSISKNTAMRCIKDDPKVAEKLVASRTHRRGGVRRKAPASGADF